MLVVDTQRVRQRRTAIFCRVTIVLLFVFKEKKMKKRTHKYFFSVGSPIRLYKSPVSIDYVEIKQRVITRTRCSRDRGLVKRRSFPDLLRKKKKACENVLHRARFVLSHGRQKRRIVRPLLNAFSPSPPFPPDPLPSPAPSPTFIYYRLARKKTFYRGMLYL